MNRLLYKLAPPLTIRRQLFILAQKVPSALSHRGIIDTLRQVNVAFQRYRTTGSLLLPRHYAAQKKTVLLVSHDMSLTGAPLMLYLLATHLHSVGFEVEIFAGSSGPLHELYAQADIPVISKPALQPHAINPTELAKIAKFYDVLIANTVLCWQAILVARAFEKPALLWVHEAQSGFYLASIHRNIPDGLALADRIVFPAAAVAQLYTSHVKPSGVRVIPYGLAMSDSTYERQPLTAKRERLRIICVGSLEPRKGQDFLLQTLNNMPRSFLETVDVLLIGRPLIPEFVQSTKLQAQAIPHITFTGAVDRQAVMEYLRSTDILILPSRDEVLPVILLEAMYHQRAIIATRVGGVAEAITDGVHGLLVDADDEAALAAALTRLCTDSELRQQLGHNAGQRFQERFTLDKMGEQFVLIIQELLETPIRREQ